jgi:uncharacterized damage-inducible protein DinB
VSERIQRIKAELAASRQHLNRVLDQVRDRWNTQVYSDGAAWTVHQLLIHLAISDKGQTNVVMGIVEGRDTVPPDFDLQRYNQRSVEKRADMTVEQARGELAASREQLYAWLDTLDESALDKRGRHASLQILSVEEFLMDMMAGHERSHADDIARVLNVSPV